MHACIHMFKCNILCVFEVETRMTCMQASFSKLMIQDHNQLGNYFTYICSAGILFCISVQ